MSLIHNLKIQIIELVIDTSTNKIQNLPAYDNTIVFILLSLVLNI